MLPKIILIIFLCFLPFSSFANSGDITLTGALEDILPVTVVSSTSSPVSSGIFSLLDKRNSEQLKISETQANIDYEAQLQKTSQSQLSELNVLLKQTQKLEKSFMVVGENSGSLLPESSLEDLKVFFTGYKQFFPDQEELWESPETFQNNLAFFLSSIENKKQEVQKLYEESQAKTKTHLEELKERENTLEKTQLSIQLQVFDAFKKIASFLGFILGTFLLARFGVHVIQKNTNSSEEKKKVIQSLIHLVRNIIIIAIVIVFFFSELLNFLPFLAILGTAIWFALRDVISSFIAWFVIGLRDTTYKLGDVIEIPRDGIFWEVVKIHPLVTTIKELGLSGPNSKFRTFPNKLIFETSLNNLWKYGGWTFISVECMITYGSDIEQARILLFDSMTEVCSSPDFTRAIDMKARLKKLGIPEKNQVPQVFVDVKTQGIFMRGKILVMWNERHEIRNRTVIAFTKKVKDTPSVELRYVDSWGIEGK